jgi:hypothetical protein
MTLVLEHKWFDMIVAGIKREEYRRITPRYTQQLRKLFAKSETERIIDFRRGYTKTQVLVECKGAFWYYPHKCFVFGRSYTS